MIISLFGCGKSNDKTDEVDVLGKEIINHLNNGSEDIYKAIHTITTKNEFGNYTSEFLLTNSLEGISNINGKGVIYFDEKCNVYHITLKYEKLNSTQLQNIYYPLNAFYLQLMTKTSNPIDIGNIDNDKTMLISNHLYNLNQLPPFGDDLLIENGNYITTVSCTPPFYPGDQDCSVQLSIGL